MTFVTNKREKAKTPNFEQGFIIYRQFLYDQISRNSNPCRIFPSYPKPWRQDIISSIYLVVRSYYTQKNVIMISLAFSRSWGLSNYKIWNINGEKISITSACIPWGPDPDTTACTMGTGSGYYCTSTHSTVYSILISQKYLQYMQYFCNI